MYISELGELWHRSRVAPDIVHLDSAAASRSSDAVIAEVTAHLWRESARGAYVAAEQTSERLDRARRDLAAMIGHQPGGIAFRESALSALRALLTYWNMPLSATVWVCPTEYGPNLDQFERRGYSVHAMPSTDGTGRVNTDALENMLQFEQPDFIHVCHIGSHSGIVQPAAKIVELAHRAGVAVVVDAAQAIGQVDCATGADIVYGTSRKWLAGPRGVGFISVRDDSLHPVEIESSEAFIAGRIGFGTAVQELQSYGLERVRRELAAIGEYTRTRLDGVGSWEVVEPVDEPSAITTLAPPPGWQDSDVAAAREALRSRGILVTCGDAWRAPLAGERSVLRISPHLDVEDTHLDDLARELLSMGW
ncbi:aminotransferase class V-fold PLP-dependent enzyme [Williamsia deligens]|uniref:Aminotransferase class V-fold PLP-dependent enzyme n=1 Tax=Williamsia deligens TaxID=321325 RepID=A0ABW3G497_9NOCA|nr:aminotransferase class V-fold PLP-dependent enzyme [Williamsia deligens]MCP2193792.1 pyridoxal 5-phosphate dependent beta-lyase [Williamsia deligens]